MTDHQPGALHRAIEPFARHGIDLVQLVSRPIPDTPWRYCFHAVLAGHPLDAADPERPDRGDGEDPPAEGVRLLPGRRGRAVMSDPVVEQIREHDLPNLDRVTKRETAAEAVR